MVGLPGDELPVHHNSQINGKHASGLVNGDIGTTTSGILSGTSPTRNTLLLLKHISSPPLQAVVCLVTGLATREDDHLNWMIAPRMSWGLTPEINGLGMKPLRKEAESSNREHQLTHKS